jgi:hypothetical protein
MAAGESTGPNDRAVFPLAPSAPGLGPGWAKLAAAVEAQVPPGEIETIYIFRPIKRQGREWGTAVITRRSAAGGTDQRLRVYTAKYMLIVRGKERGQTKIDVTEVALSPAEVLAQVMQATVDRGGDTEPPVEVSPGVWYEGRTAG